MLASIQVSFRVVVRRLRTNNEFKLRVLIYREFTVFLIHFTYKLCVSRAFLYWFLCVLSCFARKVFMRGSLEIAEGNAEKGIHGGHLRTVSPFTVRR